jgi:hypothetical protein
VGQNELPVPNWISHTTKEEAEEERKEHRGKRTSAVGNRYQRTDKDTADCEDLICCCNEL